MRASAPPYFDFLIDGFRLGKAGRHVHLGYWDDPPPLSAPCGPDEFETAQARLAEVLIGLADIDDGQCVLDVGCGFGGALEILARHRQMDLVGMNIDPRQLEICRSLPRGDNALSLVVADACALPFKPETFDRLFCIEAMFHFRSRADFLGEAAAVLRSGGRLTLSDILMRDPGDRAPSSVAAIEAILRREYGPWPQLWLTLDALISTARLAGLKPERILDATRQTLPTYRTTAPQGPGETFPRPTAGNVLRWLHANNYLSYYCLSFTKA